MVRTCQVVGISTLSRISFFTALFSGRGHHQTENHDGPLGNSGSHGTSIVFGKNMTPVSYGRTVFFKSPVPDTRKMSKKIRKLWQN